MTSKLPAARAVLLALAAAIVALVIAALLVVSLRSAPQPYEESTPEGVVQRYLIAFEAENMQTMQDYTIDGQSRSLCNPEPYNTQPLDVQLLRSSVGTNSATVHVRFDTRDSQFLPLPDLSAYDDVFELRKINGTWLIERMPWQVGLCTEKEMGY